MNYFAIFFSIGLLMTSSAEAHHKKHAINFKTVSLGTCAELPKSCALDSDNSLVCKAQGKGRNFEEDAYDSDNVDCMKMRLWKKICAKGFASEDFKVSCR